MSIREEILTIIEKNSRIDVHELSVLIGSEEITVANELKALEDEGVICGYHILSENLIVDVDAHDGVGPEPSRTVGHLVHGLGPGRDQFLLVRAAAPADDVADARREITQEIDPGDNLPENNTLILGDSASFDGRCGGKYHG